MAVINATDKKKRQERIESGDKRKSIFDPVSDEAMEKLAKLMNDTPEVLDFQGTPWEIRPLRMGTQIMIAEAACQIVKKEKMSAGDVIKDMATQMPLVCRCIALALLNDKKRIKEEYDAVYDTLLWGDFRREEWELLLLQVLSMLDMDFFFASTNVIETIRQNTLSRKVTMKEAKQLRPELNGAR